MIIIKQSLNGKSNYCVGGGGGSDTGTVQDPVGINFSSLIWPRNFPFIVFLFLTWEGSKKEGFINC